jgi:type VI secretion system protein ImpK
MDHDPYSDTPPAKNQTWIQRGLANFSRIGRSGAPAAIQGSPNPLRDIFTDMIAYVIFFEASCNQQPPSASALREKLLALANAQEERVKSYGIAAESFREARFAVLAWVDETILNSNWPHRMQWQHLMLSYYGTLNAGEEFFGHLDNLPTSANEVREIYYLCLSLGFEGRYAFGDNRHQLRDLKQRLYKQLSNNAGDIRQNYGRLFPEAYQRVAVAAAAPAHTNRYWYIAIMSIPVLLFIALWFLLRNEGNRLITEIRKPRDVTETWQACLTRGLNQKEIPAKDSSRGVVITLGSLLFEINSIQISGKAHKRIDELVDVVKGCARDSFIVVEGHASGEKGVNETRNLELSQGRARTVGALFSASGFPQDRITVRGFGSSAPVATNDTEDGRARNRRVEIIVRK